MEIPNPSPNPPKASIFHGFPYNSTKSSWFWNGSDTGKLSIAPSQKANRIRLCMSHHEENKVASCNFKPPFPNTQLSPQDLGFVSIFCRLTLQLTKGISASCKYRFSIFFFLSFLCEWCLQAREPSRPHHLPSLTPTNRRRTTFQIEKTQNQFDTGSVTIFDSSSRVPVINPIVMTVSAVLNGSIGFRAQKYMHSKKYKFCKIKMKLESFDPTNYKIYLCFDLISTYSDIVLH